MRTAVFYATREGHAERVAERVATDLRAQGVLVDVIDVRDVRGSIEWRAYHQAFVVASVHAGHHEKEMIAFVKRSKAELTRLQAPFLSLTLSQAGAEMPANSLLQRQMAHEDALRMIYDFVRDTGWQPARVLPVAGALAYTKYNFLMKFIMKRIAHKAGFDGPTSRDYEFTNWPEVDRFVAEPSKAA
jgi:menaquinone-dependent protoporphyrinogen oxidase